MRLLTATYPCTDLSPQADPSCIAHFGPGHVTRDRSHYHAHSNIATTYVTFSPCGQELLANLSADQVYLFNTVTLDPLFQYCIEDSEPSLSQRPPFCPPVLPLDQYDRYQLCLTEANVPLVARQLRDRGNQHYQQKQYTKAIYYYSSALNECPNWHILYSNRATALVSRNWYSYCQTSILINSFQLGLVMFMKRCGTQRELCVFVQLIKSLLKEELNV